MTIVSFLVILTLVVFVHEMGHFLVARWNGVRVEVFSIGFGPELLGFTDRRQTRWKLALLPLGGYVKFFGDSDASSSGADGREMTEAEKAVSFHHKSVWRRIAIVFAGPAANLVFALVVFTAVYAAIGQSVTPPVVDSVQPGSAAAEAGLQPGDRIIAVNGSDVERFEELQRLIPLSAGNPITLTVARDGETLTVTATPQMQEITDSLGETREVPVLGVTARTDGRDMVQLGPVEAVDRAFDEAYGLVHATVVSVGQMVTGQRGTDDLGGPVRIAEMSGQVAKLGVISMLLFAAFLSINLGLINLLPIPVLDGGHLLFYAIEAVRGAPVGERTQEYAFRLGLVLIVGLMVFVTSNDILRQING